jgi:integral membrane sensor domain MASE1
LKDPILLSEIHSVFVFLFEADRIGSTTSAVVAAPVLTWTTHTSLAGIASAVIVWT